MIPSKGGDGRATNRNGTETNQRHGPKALPGSWILEGLTKKGMGMKVSRSFDPGTTNVTKEKRMRECQEMER